MAGPPTVHGALHGLAGLACFTLISCSSLALATCLRGEHGWRRWPPALAACGVLVLGFFLAFIVATVLDEKGAAPNAPSGLLERIAIVVGWGALGLVSWRLPSLHVTRSLRRR